MPHKIAVILPPREGFSPTQFGAISLCIRDFTLHSRYKKETVVLGGIPGASFEDIHYVSMQPSHRWYQTRTRAYAETCAQYLQNNKASLVEIHNRPLLALHIAKRVTPPLVMHLHNDPQEMKAASSVGEREKLLETCVGIYCVSDYIRQRFLEGITRHRDKVHVIYNGLTLPVAQRPKKKLITFVGRMTSDKGGIVAAHALCDMLPDFPDWKGVFIGGRHHAASEKLSRYEREMHEVAKQVPGQMIMAGFKTHDEAMAALAESEIALVPSVWPEPFGRTALEAMAAGCAVISSNTGGLPEVTGDAALTLEKPTHRVLEQALRKLASDGGLRQELQQKALKQAERFEIGIVTKALDDIREAIIRA